MGPKPLFLLLGCWWIARRYAIEWRPHRVRTSPQPNDQQRPRHDPERADQLLAATDEFYRQHAGDRPDERDAVGENSAGHLVQLERLEHFRGECEDREVRRYHADVEGA